MIGARLRDWLNERVPIPIESLRRPLREELPIHLKSWLWCLGGTPLLLFGIQVATGILLTFYYVPSPAGAYDSIQAIDSTVRYGWFVRGIHQAAAQLMFISVLLHILRVLVTRAYRKPRELTWLLGMGLFLSVLGFAFSGYSLVNDQLSYWATTVGTNVLGMLPMVGRPILWMLRGGPEVGPNTLTRLYNFHIGVVPTVFVAILASHLLLVRLHGVARLENDARKETYWFFPQHMLREAAIGLVLILALVIFAIISPPGLGDRADPTLTPAHIRPEWYFFPSYRWLKLVPAQIGLWTSGLFVAGLITWPWIDAAIERIWPRRNFGLIVAAGAWLFTLVLLVWEAVS